MRFRAVFLCSLVAVILGFAQASADTPQTMSIQGRLTDSTGTPLVPGTKLFTFSIYNDSSGGVELWPGIGGETIAIVTDPAGLWNAELGKTVPIPAFIFSDTTHWLQIVVDDGFTPPVTLPRVHLVTSPFAFQAVESMTAVTATIAQTTAADAVNSLSIVNGSIQFDDIGQNGAQAGQIMKWTGANWAPANDSTGTGGDNDWILNNKVLYSGGAWGIARAGNTLIGDSIAGHTNLGVACTTGNVSQPALHAVVSGGFGNLANDNWSTAGGGIGNRTWGEWSTIGGGDSNSTNGLAATVAGGMFNKAHHSGAFIGGGSTNEITAIEGTISGGVLNLVGGEFGTICGGFTNRAYGRNSFVGGGGSFSRSDSNVATGDGAAVVGGQGNYAAATCAAVGGGSYNRARGAYSTVAGGGGPADSDSNSADGDWSAIAGGRGNVAAGNYSFAGGRHALALHDGCFIWADTTDTDFVTNVDNEFAVRAQGGVYVEANNTAYGASFINNASGDGLRVFSNVSQGTQWASVYAVSFGTSPAFYGSTAGDTVAYLNGDVVVNGFIYKLGGGFHIDHPLDPENKYLNHSFVESPDMMNVYNGNITLDTGGQATVRLPDWFDALNRDFRYQLTAIGAPGPNLYIAEEITGNQFRIAGGEPGARVSWQVTGIRDDASAQRNRIAVEEVKPVSERGLYLDARAFGKPKATGIGRSPKMR